MRVSFLLTVSLTFGLVACGTDHAKTEAPSGADCTRDARKDVYAASMMKSGTAGYQVRLLESVPAPPQKNDNSWRFEVVDPNARTVSDASVAVVPFMPDHGHGTPIPVVVTAPAAAETAYRASPINLWMPGLWRVSMQISQSSKLVDTVEFFFCIQG
jgi:hypothetical protein